MTTPPTILSEQEIVSTRQGMLKGFGFLQFARAIESAAIKAYAAKLAQGVELELIGFAEEGDVAILKDGREHVIKVWTHGSPNGQATVPLCLLSTAQAAVAAERAKAHRCKGTPREGCDYLASCGSICNKCGREHALSIQSSPAPAAEPAWRDETESPAGPGWFAVRRADGSLCLRAFGRDGLWWIPLRDGWMSGLPAGFQWFGPLADIDWNTPAATPSPLPAPTVPADRAGLAKEAVQLLKLLHRVIGEPEFNGYWWNVVNAIDRLASSAAQVPEGMALVPLRMNAEMQRVSQEDGWQWEDLLAAAGCTEEQCIAAAEAPAQVPEPSASEVALYLALKELDGEPAGLTPEIVFDREAFNVFMDKCDASVKAAQERAARAIAKFEAAWERQILDRAVERAKKLGR